MQCPACHARAPCGNAQHAAAWVEEDARCALAHCLLPRRYHDALARHDDVPPRFVAWAVATAPLARMLPPDATFAAAHADAVAAVDWPRLVALFRVRHAFEDAELRKLAAPPPPPPPPVPQLQTPPPLPQLQTPPHPELVAPHLSAAPLTKDQGAQVALYIIVPALLAIAVAVATLVK